MDKNFDEEIEIASEALNEKQLKFCDHYLAYGNAREAYDESGYETETNEASRANASRLLANDNVQRYIKLMRDKKAKDHQITIDKILMETAKIAFGSGMESVAEVREGDLILKENADLSLMDSISASKSYGEAGQSSGFSVKRKDRLKALDMLAKMLGGYNAKPGTGRDSEGVTAERVLKALGRVRKEE